jgi:hypothetical protein
MMESSRKESKLGTTDLRKMKLGSFIAQTLIEIIDGVTEAQGYAMEKGASINPRHVNWSDSKQGFFTSAQHRGPDDQPLLSPIEFEILLTIGEDDKAQGGVGIFAASLGLGVRGEVKESSETVNKISFKILAKLPQQKAKPSKVNNPESE